MKVTGNVPPPVLPGTTMVAMLPGLDSPIACMLTVTGNVPPPVLLGTTMVAMRPGLDSPIACILMVTGNVPPPVLLGRTIIPDTGSIPILGMMSLTLPGLGMPTTSRT
jgi:hypothetical protein